MSVFSNEEQPLLTGTNKEIAEFIDADRCIVIDWKSAEEDTLWNVQHCLPDGEFEFQIEPDSESSALAITIRFRDRENRFTLPPRPQNCFRVLIPASAHLLPDYEVKLFRATEGDDTYAFLLRSAAWWDAFRDGYPARYAETFLDLETLRAAWDLDAAPIPLPESSKKPWWKLW